MAKLTPARRAALIAILQARESGRYVREVVPHAAEDASLDERDAAFALRLALGTTATRGCLDDALACHLDAKRKLDPGVRDALRISAFEALYLDAAPDVVVSQGVELVRSVSHGAAGLANAVLRRVCEGRCAFLEAREVDEGQRAMVSRARRAGLPTWLVRRIVSSVGEERACEMLSAQLEPAPTAAYTNPEAQLYDVAWMKSPYLSASVLLGCYEGLDIPTMIAADAFGRAQAVVSDLHAQLIAAAATRPGSCLEIGSGRGTKTFVMHAVADRAEFERVHVALDLSEGKCRANAERIERAGFPAPMMCTGDATALDAALHDVDVEAGQRMLFDTVFVDAPCTGTGTMRRHPEIPWRLDPAEADRQLPELQLAMMREAASRVASGGELFYATCSVLRAENADVLDAFLASEIGSAFQVERLSDADVFGLPQFSRAGDYIASHEDERGLFQTVPTPGGYDGHFCVRLRRVG